MRDPILQHTTLGIVVRMWKMLDLCTAAVCVCVLGGGFVVLCCVVLRCVVLCCVVWCGVVSCCVVLCGVVLCGVPKALLPKGKRPGCLPTGKGKRAGLCVLCARRA